MGIQQSMLRQLEVLAESIQKLSPAGLPLDQAAALHTANPTTENPLMTAATTADFLWQMQAMLFKTPEDFGAVGNDTHNDTKALNDAISYCAVNSRPLLLTPGATYLTTSLVQIGDGKQFVSLYMTGRQPGMSPGLATATIHCTSKTSPGLNIQGARYVHVTDLLVIGDNTEPTNLGTIPQADVSKYVSAGFSNSRWSPQAAITFDAFSGPDPGQGQGYPGATYGQQPGGAIHLERVQVQRCVVGFLNLGTGLNSENIWLEKCAADGVCVPYAICQTQARANTYKDCSAVSWHTLFDTRTYGAQLGSAPEIQGGTCSVGYRIFNINTSFDTLSCSKLYTEAVSTFGTITGQFGAKFSACSFLLGIGDSRAVNPIVHGTLACLTSTFDTCIILTRKPFFNLLHSMSGQGHTVFEQCTFSSSEDPSNPDYQVCSRWRRGYNRVSVIRSNIGQGVLKGGVPSLNETPDITFPANRVAISQCTRWVRTYGTTNGYIGNGDLNVWPGFPDHAVSISASGYSWGEDGTLTFQATTAGEFALDDLLYWRVATDDAGGSLDANLAAVGTGLDDVNGSVPALRVIAITETTVSAFPIGTITELDQTASPAVVFVALRDWAPVIPLTIATTQASATAQLTPSNFPIQVGDFIKASNLPTLCRVLSCLAGAVTLSKPAITTATATSYCSRLVPLPQPG